MIRKVDVENLIEDEIAYWSNRINNRLYDTEAERQELIRTREYMRAVLSKVSDIKDECPDMPRHDRDRASNVPRIDFDSIKNTVTFSVLFDQFLEKTHWDRAEVVDYRPATPPFHSEHVPNAIVIWMKNGVKFLYAKGDLIAEFTWR